MELIEPDTGDKRTATEIEETHFELCEKLHCAWDGLSIDMQKELEELVYRHYEP